jgi:hypothetical protein
MHWVVYSGHSFWLNHHGMPTIAVSWISKHPRIFGAIILLLLHAAFLSLRGLYVDKPETAYLLLGVLQVFYLVPALILLLKAGRPEMAKGMALAAALTFVLNASACGVMYSLLSQIG